MKKIYFILLFFVTIFAAVQITSKVVVAANECSQIWIDPGQTVVVGTIITLRVSGCPPTNVGYKVQLLDSGTVVATLDMAALTTDKSQYSATIPQSAQLNQGNYALAQIDNSTGNIIRGIGLKVGSDTVVTDINAEAFLDTHRNLVMCIGGFASANDLHGTSVKISCTRANPFHLCPLPVQLSFIDVEASEPDENGKVFGCKTLQGISPDITQINLDFFQGPTPIYSLVVDTTRGREPYLCHPNGNSEFEGIQTAIGCIPFDTDDPVNDMVAFFVRWSVGIAGGISMLLLIAGSYQVITSQGDKYKLQSGKDMLLAAVSGLVLVIFAVMLVRVIGQNILDLF